MLLKLLLKLQLYLTSLKQFEPASLTDSVQHLELTNGPLDVLLSKRILILKTFVFLLLKILVLFEEMALLLLNMLWLGSFSTSLSLVLYFVTF